MPDTTGGARTGSAPEVRPALSSWLRTQTMVEHQAAEDLLYLDRPLAAAEAVHVLQGWGAVWCDVRMAAGARGCAVTAARKLLPMADQALAWLATDLGGAGPHAPGALPCLRALLADDAAAWGGRLRPARLADERRRAGAPGRRRPGTAHRTDHRRSSGGPGTELTHEWVSFRRRLDASGASRPAPSRPLAGPSAGWPRS